MRKAIVVPTVRPDLMTNYLRTLKTVRELDDWELHVVAQAWPEHELTWLRADSRVTKLIEIADRTHPYVCRAMAWQAASDVDFWCATDDDMEFLPGWTNWSAAQDRAAQPGVGIVSCNWVRSEKFLAKKRLVNGFVKQAIVNMSGGMVFSKRVTPLLLEDVRPWLFDDTQMGLVTYLAGLENFRDLSSVLIHRILGPGGVKVLHNTRPLVKPPEDILPLEPCKPIKGMLAGVDNAYNIPMSERLTAKAHEIHKLNRARWQ